MEPVEVVFVSFFTVLFFLAAPRLILLGVSCVQQSRRRRQLNRSNHLLNDTSNLNNGHGVVPESNPTTSRLIDLMVFEYVQPPPELLEKMKRGEPYTGRRVLGTRDENGQLITQIDVMELYGSTSTNTSCCICLGDYENGESCARSAKCEHIWHKDCIEHWISKGHVICPLCRTSLVVSSNEAMYSIIDEVSETTALSNLNNLANNINNNSSINSLPNNLTNTNFNNNLNNNLNNNFNTMANNLTNNLSNHLHSGLVTPATTPINSNMNINNFINQNISNVLDFVQNESQINSHMNSHMNNQLNNQTNSIINNSSIANSNSNLGNNSLYSNYANDSIQQSVVQNLDGQNIDNDTDISLRNNILDDKNKKNKRIKKKKSEETKVKPKKKVIMSPKLKKKKTIFSNKDTTVGRATREPSPDISHAEFDDFTDSNDQFSPKNSEIISDLRKKKKKNILLDSVLSFNEENNSFFDEINCDNKKKIKISSE